MKKAKPNDGQQKRPLKVHRQTERPLLFESPHGFLSRCVTLRLIFYFWLGGHAGRKNTFFFGFWGSNIFAPFLGGGGTPPRGGGILGVFWGVPGGGILGVLGGPPGVQKGGPRGGPRGCGSSESSPGSHLVTKRDKKQGKRGENSGGVRAGARKRSNLMKNDENHG